MGRVISALPLYMGSDLLSRRKKGGSRAFLFPARSRWLLRGALNFMPVMLKLQTS